MLKIRKMQDCRSQGQRPVKYTYMRLCLQLGAPVMRTTEDTFMQVLEEALTTLYGLIGGALLIDLIEFKALTGVATLRCRKGDVQRIWAAATFVTKFNNVPCRLKVLEASPSLVPDTELEK
ncbi:uncharacterized protein LOC131027731 isoform X1 [Cryptomeria japonica]|uniref:uncharacterized protein LOC131027731 isoform X1 n=2 Tax=Cryptomeria japonica TaxID=3369 RepID=UPI0025ACA4A8|nr:uncharacterized protein LOC131027731 isoform X1 [Cryptomeria japonica]XP_057813805.1 uncharacterized protein LOC131027731 isoform X1 [Cryptomeria japonica]XP_057813806.1 uncharacterized protein LOC131027731 isoform X1 [Cryptomeria japonica]XP_057813807.1 uncharacterized protein LOC131027731 isoform X1 [Cryptomeria japonica]